MKTFISAAVLAGAIAFAVCVAHAAPAVQSRVALENVGDLSVQLADVADQLNLGASRADHFDAESEQLNTMREEINQIGRELGAMESQEGALPDWQRKTLDEVVPIMQDIASSTQRAIENLNTNRNHVWATSFPEQAATISKDAERVKEIVQANLKLASVRDQEQRLEAKADQVQ